jgi:choline kinase
MKTRVLILAAGQGTRLRPLTNNKPKCLVPLAGKSLLQRQVQTLKNSGIVDIHIATGFCTKQIKELGFETSFNPRFAETNMVETLFSAKKFIEQDGDLIIAYGDIIYNQENLEILLASNDEIALMIDKKWKDLWSIRLENPLEDAETLMMDENGYITELGKKPESYERIQGQYTGLIKIRADKVKDFLNFYESLDKTTMYDGNNFDNMYMTSFLQLLIDSEWKVKASLVENGWLEVDSVDDLEHYEKMAIDGTLDKFYKVID